MSKDNLFLGFARGSVGDVTFTRVNGVQVARARNRSPRNPKTPIQLLQRVCMKTAALGYSLLQDICNHSFQGRAEGTECQSRFTTLNVAAFRSTLQDLIDSGDPEQILYATVTNFAKKSSTLAEFMPYIISEGTLPTMRTIDWGGFVTLDLGTSLMSKDVDQITYQDVVDALGLQQGDQLTFLWLSIDDQHNVSPTVSQFNGFRYSRIILEPNDGDMSSIFVDHGSIVKPNVRNEGDGVFIVTKNVGDGLMGLQTSHPSFSDGAGHINSLAGGAVIASRMSGGVWQRSTQSLYLRSDEVGGDHPLTWSHHEDYLGEAIDSYLTNDTSSLYLNQAEV